MTQSRDKDGGWAWVVLMACSACVLVTSGIAVLAGMFQKMFLDHFHGDVVLISWITALFASVMQLAGPVAGVVCTVFGCRVSVMAGATLLTIGLFLSSLCESTTTLLVTFGITSGMGLGLIYSAAVVRVNLSFVRYRPMASSTVLASGGLGITLGPFLCGHLLEQMGWAQTLTVLSALSAQLVVAGALLYPAQAHNPRGLGWCCVRFQHCVKVRRTATAEYCWTENVDPPIDQQQQHQLPPSSKSPLLSTESEPADQSCTQVKSQDYSQTVICGPTQTADSTSEAQTEMHETICLMSEEVRTTSEGDEKNTEDLDQRKCYNRADKTSQEFSEAEEEEKEDDGEDEKRAFLSRCLQHTSSHSSPRDSEEPGTLSKSVKSPQKNETEMTVLSHRLHNSKASLSTSAQNISKTRESTASPTPFSESQQHPVNNRPTSAATKQLTISSNNPLHEPATPLKATTTTTETATAWRKFLTILKSPALMLICAQLFLANAATGIVLVHFVEFCQQAGTDFDTVSLAFSVNGMTLTMSRFLLGALSQDRNVDPLAVYVGLALISSVILITMPVVAVTGAAQITMIGALGIYAGGSYAMLTEITIHCTGVDTLGLAFGLEMTLAGLGYLVAPPIAGWLVVVTHSYTNAIFLAGFLSFLASFLAMAVSLARPVWKPSHTGDVEDVIAADENKETIVN